MTTARRVSLPLLACVLLLCCESAAGQGRRLLSSKGVSGKLREVVRLLSDPGSDKAACRQSDWPAGFYFRVSARKNVFDERDEVKPGAVLGGRPFVFMTTPEDVCGLSLLEIYERIGYEAEFILACQQDDTCAKDMVAVVFRYPAGISASGVCDGALPPDWDKKIYKTTWDNLFSLFTRLAEGAEIRPDKKDDDFAPVKTFFRSAADRYFVLGFPEEGKRRIRTSPYTTLKGLSGADWVYRRLLESKLSAFEHFRGDGHTWDEVRDPDGLMQGLSEFVGPNAKINSLDEFAIIHLGQLAITVNYPPK